VTIEDFELIQTAADLEGVDRSVIVAQGSLRYAVQVIRRHATLLRDVSALRLRRAADRARRRRGPKS